MIDPCSLISSGNVRDRILHMTSLSLEDGLERGFLIFEDKEGIKMTGVQKGGKHSIRMKTPSVLGLGLFPRGNVFGSVHVHPNERFDTLLSMMDLDGLFRDRLDFSAAVFDKGVRGNKIKAKVISPRMFNSFDDVVTLSDKQFGSLDFVKDLNDELLECTVEIGEINQR